MFNILKDPSFVSNYYGEYLKTVNFYQNLKRPSCFIRYYNINIENSIFDEKSESTYDIYKYSQVKFNIYDYTPTFYLAPIVNAASSIPDMRGQMLDSATNIVIYTLERPRFNDLMTFYDPIKSEEIYRVSGVKLASNSVHANPNVNWYELDLEIAPIKTFDDIKINQHYIYDLSIEKYKLYSDYLKMIQSYTNYENLLKDLQFYYEPYNDVYKFNEFVPVIVNELILLFRKNFNYKFSRLFESYPSPYGYLDKNLELRYNSINDINYDIKSIYDYECLNLKTNCFKNIKFNCHHDEYNNKSLNNLIYLGHLLYSEILKNGNND